MCLQGEMWNRRQAKALYRVPTTVVTEEKILCKILALMLRKYTATAKQVPSSLTKHEWKGMMGNVGDVAILSVPP